jgi:2-methylthioadenine synthetase
MDLWWEKAGPRQPVDSSRGPTLAALLREIQKIEGEFWVRLLYTHPAHWSDELIETIAESDKVARYIDIPLQHIDESMLGRMRRETSRAHIEKVIDKLRAGIPGVALRSTFIVGFPGETETEFETLLDFIKRTRFERLGIFQVLPRRRIASGKNAKQSRQGKECALPELPCTSSNRLHTTLCGKKLDAK